MLGDELCHLKHRHGALAAENSFQLRIRVDISAVFLVLQIVLLNVVP